MKKRLLALAAAAAMTASLFSGCAASSSNTVKIGAIQPISGKVSAYGTQSRDAINMAVEEINAKGGVLGGKNLEVFIEDDEANAEKTLTAFKKLSTQNKVVGIVGALTSSCSIPLSKEAQKRKIIMISPSSTNDSVTDAGDYIFRACYKDSFQGPVVAQFATETLKATKAAILFDNGNDYSKGMKDNFKKKFEELGGTVVAVEAYTENDQDFAAQLTKIKGTAPDVIFVPDYYNKISLIAKQVRAQGIEAPMMGADGWDEIANNAGEEVVGSYYSNHYAADAQDNDVKTFVENFKKKYKTDVAPNALAALAYDATYILAEAIDRAGSTKPEDIKAAMMQTDKKFVTGNIKFDDHRDPIKTITMVKVVKAADGKLGLEFAGTVDPVAGK